MSLADSSPQATPTYDLLASPEVRQQVCLMSVDNYHRLGEQGLIDKKTELIRGVVIKKMSQSPLHCYIVQVILHWLLQELPDEWMVRPANPVTTPDSEPEPDLCVIYGSPEDYLTEHPTTAALTVEVAISSEKLDLQKANIYAEAEIDEYWIVYGERRHVVVYLKPRNGQYTETKTFYPGEILKPVSLPGLSIAVENLFPTEKESE